MIKHIKQTFNHKLSYVHYFSSYLKLINKKNVEKTDSLLDNTKMKNNQNNAVLIIMSFFLGLISYRYLSTIEIDQIPQKARYIQKAMLQTEENNDIQVMFTPGDPCTNRIVQHILSAKKEILVQAYSFTSQEIINALLLKHKKGVKVIIILDKSQEKSIYTMKVKNAGIPIFIDKLKGIAHNKIIIIDKIKVFTGSFNFSRAAQISNAENSILITIPKIVQQFIKNFEKRKAVSHSAFQSKL